jgi:hypothetical protein
MPAATSAIPPGWDGELMKRQQEADLNEGSRVVNAPMSSTEVASVLRTECGQSGSEHPREGAGADEEELGEHGG